MNSKSFKDYPWLQTHTGEHFDYFWPQLGDIQIDDIVHSLSNVCRFNGHTKEFYSVANHSMNVYFQMMEHENDPTWGMKIYALMHDAAEAYICDIPSGIKDCLYVAQPNVSKSEMEKYKEYEKIILKYIIESIFGKENVSHILNKDIQKTILKYDLYVLLWEKRDMLAVPDMHWDDEFPQEVLDMQLPEKILQGDCEHKVMKSIFKDMITKYIV